MTLEWPDVPKNEPETDEWEGYPEDDGYEDNPIEYNFWDDRTHGA
jgi:hypothetical protein